MYVYIYTHNHMCIQKYVHISTTIILRCAYIHNIYVYNNSRTFDSSDVADTALVTRCHELLKQAPTMPTVNVVLAGSSSSMTCAASHLKQAAAFRRPRGPGRVVVPLIQK